MEIPWKMAKIAVQFICPANSNFYCSNDSPGTFRVNYLAKHFRWPFTCVYVYACREPSISHKYEIHGALIGIHLPVTGRDTFAGDSGFGDSASPRLIPIHPPILVHVIL